ncbi:MAG TPA: alcohol dehydrogenase catalytic domain-containing protein [Candidatus Deferrimicrobium sp.]|nr:alcohol dehydrogenase catalytic domain-containing protein [Candidatus Deferrimicrobium sp.]
MKALVLKGINQLEFCDDFPKPIPAKNEVLIKVRYCGICGSDLEAYQYGKVLMPLILGHEFSGDVIEKGEAVEGWEIGDRVTAYPGNFCGKCFFCEQGQENRCAKMLMGLGITVNGALAEYVKIPAKSLCKLPDSVSYEEGAIVEPLSVGYHGVRGSGIRSNDTALVIGAGTVGLSTIQSLNLLHVEQIYIIEPSIFNRNLALQMGAQEVNRPARINKVGPDFVFDCAGFPDTYKNDIQIVRYGGTVILLGVHFELVPVSFLQLIAKEAILKGSFGYSFQEFKEVLSRLTQKKYRPELIISKKVKLEKAIEEGFQELLSPTKQAVKILVEI